MEHLKRKVIHCLDTYPHTRNSDIHLMMAIIHQVAPQEIIKVAGKDFISVEALKLVREDQVSRIRRQLNEKGLFLPDDPKVRRARQINEEEWRKFLGYNPEMRKV